MTMRRRNRVPSGPGITRLSHTSAARPLFVNEPVPKELRTVERPKSRHEQFAIQTPERAQAIARHGADADQGPDKRPSIFDSVVREVDVRETLAPSRRRMLSLAAGSWRRAAITVLAAVAVLVATQAFRTNERPSDSIAALAAVSTAAPVTAPPPIVTARPPIVPAPPPAATTAAPPPTSQGQAPTSTAPTVSTTTSTATTTAPPTPFIEPVGDPVDLEDLTLSVVGIGPLQLGSNADRVLGALAASLGQPDFDSGPVTGGAHGTCPEGTFRVVQWGPLGVISRLEDGTETFDSYRVDLRVPDSTDQTPQLQTLSGFAAGSTTAELEEIYASGFRVTYTDHPVQGEIFELSSGQGFLLWGPITTSNEDGIVQGIFSPETC